MHAPVVDHAAAVILEGTPAVHCADSAVNAALNGIDLADGATFHHVAHDAVILIPAAVLVHGEQLAGFLADGDHLVPVRDRERGGLFAEHILARAHSGDGIGLVELIGSSDQHQVDLRDGQQLFCGMAGLHAEFLFRRFQRLFIHIERRDVFHAVDLAGVGRMPVRHAAKADDADFQCHSLFPPVFLLFSFLYSSRPQGNCAMRSGAVA